MSLRDQLLDIYSRHRELTPAIVVDEARDERHPLHKRFEWDDTTAAEKYRQVQAAELIRSVKVVYAEEPVEKSVRGFVNIRRESPQTSGSYIPVEEAVADDLTRKLLIRECEREWKAFRAKYDHLAEFASITSMNNSVGAA